MHGSFHVCIISYLNILFDLLFFNFLFVIINFSYFFFCSFVFYFYSFFLHPVVVSQERALLLYLRYASRWGNQTMRGFIKVNSIQPARHCAPHMCPCQFIEQHLKCKPQGKFKYLRISYWCSASEYYD